MSDQTNALLAAILSEMIASRAQQNAVLSELSAIRQLISPSLAPQTAPPPEPEIWLSASEASALLGITTRQVRRIAHEQGLGEKAGGRWEIRKSELVRVRRYVRQTDISDMETDISDVSATREQWDS
ncbi:helix-turn-helix domain-containing protein [Asticcacaulis sp. YBE204]|uniref:helix-turn-helix domain-containing protein n=1 Tax=Asticcacaulis sp. YBE204 TaxID=1282363 RepID=UPI0003C3BDED|nr:helix-turn-helix domain-containing protein [Asticcacaulis sp. YBE204]ESQ76912.1 hypothetical protein AEYBE204_18725 [Asticcacaulis sp. YBE204]